MGVCTVPLATKIRDKKLSVNHMGCSKITCPSDVNMIMIFDLLIIKVYRGHWKSACFELLGSCVVMLLELDLVITFVSSTRYQTNNCKRFMNEMENAHNKTT